jgi:hypothetical protein
MTCACCPACRVRFSEAATAYFAACPKCGRKPQAISRPEDVVGFQLINLELTPSVPEAAAAAVSLPAFSLSDLRS